MTTVVALGMELLAENSPLLITPLDYLKSFVLTGHCGRKTHFTRSGRLAIRVLLDRPRAKMATSGEPLPDRSAFEWGATICFPMLAAASVSWGRYALSGSLGLPRDGLSTAERVAVDLAFGVCAAFAAAAYLRALRREPALSTRSVLVVATLAATCAAFALPLTSNDVFQNLLYGRLCEAGKNPFVVPPAEIGGNDPYLAAVLPHWTQQKFIYGPLIAVADCLSGKAGTLAASLATFKAEILLLAVAALLLLPVVRKAALASGAAPAPVLYFAWNPLFLWEIAGQAHNDVVMLLPELGFVAAALANQELLAVLCLAVAFCAKYSVAPVLLLYLLYLARRSPLRGALMLGVVVAVCAAFFAPWWEGPRILLAPLPEVGADANHHARSFTSILCWLVTPLGRGAQTWTYGAARIISGLGLLAVAARAAHRARTVRSTLREALVFLLAYDLVAAAWFQSWYVTWVLPLAMVDSDHRVRYAVAVYSVLSLVQYGIDLDPVTYLFVNGIPLFLLLRGTKPVVAVSA